MNHRFLAVVCVAGLSLASMCLAQEAKRVTISPAVDAAVDTAQAGPLAAATPITVHVKNAKPREALDQISKSAGFTFPVWPDFAWNQNPEQDPHITIDAESQPLGVVLREFCIQANARIEQINNMPFCIVQGGGEELKFRPAYVSVAHWVYLQGLSRTQSLSFEVKDQPKVVESRSVNLGIHLDPRMNVAMLGQRVWVDQAVDENGTSLAIPDAGGKDNFQDARNNRGRMDRSLELNYDWTKSKLLKTLKGHARVMVVASTETIEIPDALKAEGMQKSATGVKFTLSGIKEAGDGYDYQVTLARAADATDEGWNLVRQSIWNGAVKWTDSDGRALQNVNRGTSSNRRQVVTRQHLQAGADAKRPFKLVFSLVASTQPLDLDFEFHDLPLP